MKVLDIIAALIALCAAFSYLNHRYLRLPTTIGVMVISLSSSLLLIALDSIGIGLTEEATQAVHGLHFDETLMQWMLGFLLFAGALHIDFNELAEERTPVAVLATLGVVSCTALVGGASYLLFQASGMGIPLLYCLLFGALISPTDPIAVLGILRQVDAPKSLRVRMAGESLFNDGVGVVVFLVLLGIAAGGHDVSVTGAVWLLLVEAVGGLAYGLAIGSLAYLMLKSVDNYQVEVLITLALVMGGYTLARELHTSGPLAMVVAGLMIGNHGRALAMSETTREHLDTFWELLDEILNAVLFVLIGFELLILKLKAPYLLAGLLAVPVVLLARFLSVGLPMTFLGARRNVRPDPHEVKVLTWGGLRGGISVALALSLPAGPERDALVVVTYVVVAFSIIAQGLSFGPLLERLYGSEA